MKGREVNFVCKYLQFIVFFSKQFAAPPCVRITLTAPLKLSLAMYFALAN